MFRLGNQILDLLAEQATADTVWNIGHVALSPGAANVVPEAAEITLEVRDTSGTHLDTLEDSIRSLTEAAGTGLGLPIRMDRVTVEELRTLMDDAKVVAILDVRSPMSQEATGRIPGARTIDIEAMGGLELVPRGDEGIVYCACPNEASAVQVAKRLRAAGFRRVRPLAGGIDAWLAAGLEVER